MLTQATFHQKRAQREEDVFMETHGGLGCRSIYWAVEILSYGWQRIWNDISLIERNTRRAPLENRTQLAGQRT